jgi:hypothetical protein
MRVSHALGLFVTCVAVILVLDFLLDRPEEAVVA